MLGDLGALADLERGGRPLEPTPLDGVAMMRDAAGPLRPHRAARGQQVRWSRSPGTLVGCRSPDRIVANLVANAMADIRSRIWWRHARRAPLQRPSAVLAVGPGHAGVSCCRA